MKLRLEQLSSHLKQSLLPIYVISGDEPLLAQEAVDTLTRITHEQGYLRQRLSIESPSDWQQFAEQTASLSLFSSKELLVVQLASPKIGDVGSKTLRAYAAKPARDKIVIVVTGKMEPAIAQSSWMKALDKIGVIITLWPLTGSALMQWLRQHAKQLQIELTPSALQVLIERTTGNLLASKQELEKLALLAPNTLIDERLLMACVHDNAQFSLFDVIDVALAGDLRAVVRGLSKLQAEQIEPTLVLWGFTKQVRELIAISQHVTDGVALDVAIKNAHVWASRQMIVKRAVQRHSLSYWQNVLSLAAIADRLIKGVERGDVWDYLLMLYERLAGVELIARSEFTA